MNSKFVHSFFLLVILLMSAFGEEGSYWQPYEPGKNTLILLHFDGDIGDISQYQNPAKPIGDATVISGGRFSGCLQLKGGGVKIDLKTHLLSFVLEMWLNPDKLPEQGKEMVILDRGYIPDKQDWLQLLLKSDGTLLWKHSRRGSRFGYIGNDYALSLPGVIKPQKWQHIAVRVGFSEESAASRIYVDGKNVTAKPYCGDLSLEPPDPEMGTITIGMKEPDGPDRQAQENWGVGQKGGVTAEVYEKIKYKPESFVPYEGRIDEFRMVNQLIEIPILPDNSFIDPEKKRVFAQDGRYFPSDKDILLYASFDQSPNPDIAKGSSEVSGLKEVLLVPGVRGKAISFYDIQKTGFLAFSRKGNFEKEAGTVSFWTKRYEPMQWSGVMFNAHPYSFSPMIFLSTTYCMYPIYPIPELFPQEQWVHVTWVWNKYAGIMYVNGEKAYACPLIWSPELEMTTMTLGAGKVEIDEFKIFRRALSPGEIRNEHLRYLPKKDFTRVSDIGLMLVDFRGVNKLCGSVFSRTGEIPGASLIECRLLKEGKNLSAVSFAFQKFTDTPFIWELPENIQSGEYKIQMFIKDKQGNILAQGEQILARKEYPWLNKNIAEEDRVLYPWTDMVAKGKDIVQVTGRDFYLDDTGLFKKIDCWGDDLLVAPMRIEIKEKNTIRVLKGGGKKIKSKKKSEISWKSENSVLFSDKKKLEIKVSGVMEYDGATKFTITYSPEKEPVEIENMKIVIPVKSKYAELKCVNIGDVLSPGGENWPEMVNCELPREDGEIFSSKKEYEKFFTNNIYYYRRVPTVGNFIPQIWLGNNERGVSIFGDNDKGWVPHNNYPAIQVIRKGSITEIILNIISSSYTITGPRTVEFGLLPTPVKSLPEDWRSKRYHGTFANPWGSGSAYLADYEDDRCDIEGLKYIVNESHKRGEPATPHFDTVLFGMGKKTWNEFSAEWHSGFTYVPLYMLPESKVDFMIWYHSRWKKDLDIDGVYYDCAGVLPNFNIFSGTAYVLDDGRIQPGWTVWNERELFKRTAYVYGDLFKGNYSWGNGFYGPEISGWFPGTVVGEGASFKTRNNKELVGAQHLSGKGYHELWPTKYYSELMTGNFSFERVHGISHQWGIIRYWQGPHEGFWSYQDWKNDPPEVMDKVKTFMRSVQAQRLLLDTVGAFTGLFPKYYTDFVAKPGLKFHGFWNNKEVFKRTPEDVYVNGYRSGNEVLVIASNLSLDKSEVTVEIDLKRLGYENVTAVNVDDLEQNAIWGKTPEEVYTKYLWDGPSLLSEKEKKFSCKTENHKAVLKFLVNTKDFRAFFVKIKE